jgi:hypothetical protein
MWIHSEEKEVVYRLGDDVSYQARFSSCVGPLLQYLAARVSPEGRGI